MNPWTDIAELVQRTVQSVAAHRRYAASQSGGQVQLRTDAERAVGATAGSEYFPRLMGTPKLSNDDEVAVIMLGGRPFVLGKIQRSAPSGITLEYPYTFEQAVTFQAGANSPFFDAMVQDSSDTASTTDGNNYVDVMRRSVSLPTGTWRIWAWGVGLFSHATAGNTVRARMMIDVGVGTSIGTGMPAPNQRGAIPVAHNRGSLSGTVEVALQYRPGTNGQTAYSGGGVLWIAAHRTA